MDERTAGLTERGLRRKEAIFLELAEAQRRRVSRRRASQAGGLIALSLVAMVAAWWHLGGGGSPPSPAAPIARSGPAAERVDRLHAPRIAVVRNDAAVVARYSASGDPSRAEVIGDEELGAWLARAGRPDGFIRSPGRFLLASEVRPPDARDRGSG